ncbi:MAG: GGDEF domain-containing protein [Chloroflexi bacterium]|nr:GGDEF domain-containing protein [Chloroflexota bacterium]
MEQLSDLISANHFGEILKQIRTMVALVGRDGSLVSWNPAFGDYKEKSLQAGNLQECFPEKERTKIDDALKANQRDHFVAELGIDDEEKTVFYNCSLIPLDNERLIFIAERLDSDTSLQEIVQRLNRQVKMFQVESESAKKIARNKQAEVDAIVAQADELSNMDVLTFLPNRRLIIKALKDEISRVERYTGPFSISVVDVDHFKKVNDIYGNLVGDEVLKHVAYQLRDHIRHPDLVGRYGGEEFLILLPSTNAGEAAEQAARLCKFVREAQVQVNAQLLKVTVSIGVAQYMPGIDTWDTLLNRADAAMYEAKNKGRDRWAVAK